ncbi:DUF58 domain-containing protein [Vibrio sp. 99-70-13A1]|uniref:DUF58 domain-containing protein n=1 Tax=Vibrio sp. 99-70-13A1 TaxID=2607601 RepID=UPI001493A6BA|nr:DUF58 domain-containing protein [Vibrio sp. 99-70-13A1]NOH95656.1 DUF58 domain-containing protein [Vibrio sp. 99-70-13A1]
MNHSTFSHSRARHSALNHSASLQDERIHCEYRGLVRLQAQAESFSLLPQLKAGSALSGRHSSVFRGRGLNFEELRHYQLGDDIRNLDWKVTMRTGKPHVRAYTEEKDRNVIVCVDQRSSMYFSSVEVMKSVVAAELASLTAWRVLKDSDRVGFLMVSPTQNYWMKPRRSQADLLHRLKKLSELNQSLNVDVKDSDPTSFSQFVTLLGRLKLKEATIIILSDWSGATQDDLMHLKHLQKHNDVLGVLISDQLESEFPNQASSSFFDVSQSESLSASKSEPVRKPQAKGGPGWVVGNGELQLNLNDRQKLDLANQGLSEHQRLKKDKLIQLMAAKRLPLIEVNTSGQHVEQFKQAVGGRR